MNYDEENDKISSEFKGILNEANKKYNESETIKTFVNMEQANKKGGVGNLETSYLFLPIKILQKLGESIENGVYFSKSFFIRKEIW